MVSGAIVQLSSESSPREYVNNGEWLFQLKLYLQKQVEPEFSDL